MTNFGKNIRNTLVYSDSELLELTLGLFMLMVNPFTQTLHYIHPIWNLMGVFSSLLILIGLGKKSLRIREMALLWGLVNFTAINLIEVRHGSIELSYLFQNVIVGFLWWKVGKQRLVCQLREEGSNGNK